LGFAVTKYIHGACRTHVERLQGIVRRRAIGSQLSDTGSDHSLCANAMLQRAYHFAVVAETAYLARAGREQATLAQPREDADSEGVAVFDVCSYAFNRPSEGGRIALAGWRANLFSGRVGK
jgi:hypothetical protein